MAIPDSLSSQFGESAPMVPRELALAAAFFIVEGVWSIADAIWTLGQGRLPIPFGVLAIPAGFGIFRLSPGWRSVGLILAVAGIIMSVVFLALLLSNGATVRVLGNATDRGAAVIAALTIIVGFGWLSAWQFRVLTRPHIALLFWRGVAQPPSAEADPTDVFDPIS